MNSRRFIIVAALAAVVIMGTGLSCKSIGIPEIFGPSEGYQGAYTVLRFLATGSGNVDFVIEWGDGMTDTLTDNSPGDTVNKAHIWADAGDFNVKAMAMLTDDNTTVSEYSPDFGIKILPNGAPTADFDAPQQAVIDVVTNFTVWGVDPDGEDIAFMMMFGDDESDWTEFVASGETATVSHTFTTAGEQLEVKARAKDIHGTIGPWSDPKTLTTTDAGGMLWWWVTPDEDSAPPLTAPVVATVEDLELAYVGCDDEYMKIYGIDVSTGKKKKTGTTVVSEEGYEWSTHPAFNWATGHIIIAKEEGELYAFDHKLSREWHYPGMTRDEDLTFTEWGNPCLSGSNIFIPNIDTIVRGGDTTANVTKFYKILDGQNRPVNPPFTVIGVQEVLGAPVLDNTNNVYFVTDSGNLFKMNVNIEIQWQVRLTEKRSIFGPVIGSGGVVFCGDEDGKVYARNPDGRRSGPRRSPV